jgi:hypothetical protein
MQRLLLELWLRVLFRRLAVPLLLLLPQLGELQARLPQLAPHVALALS